MDNDESNLTFDFEEVLDAGNVAPSSSATPSGPAANGPSHGRGSGSTRPVVCRHWMRGLCMRDTECRFLHQLDKDRLQVCHFFSQHGYCREKECIFKHVEPVVNRCQMYDMGFCPNGPFCRYKHIKVPGPPPSPEEVIRRLQQMNMLNHDSSKSSVQPNHNLAANVTHIVQQPAAHHVQRVHSQHVPPPTPPPQKQQPNAQVLGAPNGSSNKAL